MTDLVTVATYRRLTGDATTSDDGVTTALDDALDLVQEALNGRLLEYGERTEKLPIIGGYVYPKATPVLYADDFEIKGRAVLVPDASLPWNVTNTFQLTYQGGFTAETLPKTLRDAIVEVAHDQLRAAVNSSTYPVGATSVEVGDASIAFGEPVGSFGISGMRADVARSISRYKRARV